MIGPAIQSGVRNSATEVTFSDIKVEFATGTGPTIADKDDTDVLDLNDWEEADAEGATFTPRYLASQYQVFWGPTEITEAFFSYVDDNSERIADETWFYNTREFYSQSRWWADGTEKDAAALPSAGDLTARELISKQTQLTINMRALQHFLIDFDLEQARSSTMAGGYADPATPLSAPPVLRTMFNGLVYVARTNRYPWNPNLNGPNPWNPNLPNDTSGAVDPITSAPLSRASLLGKAPASRVATWEALHDNPTDTLLVANMERLDEAGTAYEQALQLYTIGDMPEAPAFGSQAIGTTRFA